MSMQDVFLERLDLSTSAGPSHDVAQHIGTPGIEIQMTNHGLQRMSEGHSTTVLNLPYFVKGHLRIMI